MAAVSTRVHEAPVSTRTSTRTRTLIACGVIAGPVFVAAAFAQALTRAGFVLSDHPLSLLSLGDLGWIQIANFIGGGALYLAAAIGMGRVLEGKGAVWGPRLMKTFGVGLIMGGVFSADPAFGFPIGTPAGMPEHISWHSMVHGFAPVIGFGALVIACFVFARYFAAHRQRGWMAASIATGVAVQALTLYPNIGGDPTGRFGPMWVALVLGLGYASALFAHVRRTV